MKRDTSSFTINTEEMHSQSPVLKDAIIVYNYNRIVQ